MRKIEQTKLVSYVVIPLLSVMVISLTACSTSTGSISTTSPTSSTSATTSVTSTPTSTTISTTTSATSTTIFTSTSTSTSTSTTISTTTSTSTSTTTPLTTMTQNRCAFSNFQQQQQRIVGGNAATTIIPWQVYLLSDKTCGGTILDEWTILSAAHCYDDYPWKNSSVRAGTLDRDSGGQVREVEQTIWNQELVYHQGGPYNNDWVILKLKSPLEFNDNVQPACLPPSDDWSPDTDPDNQCFVSGWGKMNYFGNKQEYLRWVKVKLDSNSVCSQALQGQSPCGSNCGPITNSMICVNTGLIEAWNAMSAECSGNPYWLRDGSCDDINNNEECQWDLGDCCEPNANMDYCTSCECLGIPDLHTFCNGDSGGPLVCLNGTGSAILTGIVSLGGCGTFSSHDVVARVTTILDWILSNLGPTTIINQDDSNYGFVLTNTSQTGCVYPVAPEMDCCYPTNGTDILCDGTAQFSFVYLMESKIKKY